MFKTFSNRKVIYILLVLGAFIVFFPILWMGLTSLKTPMFLFFSGFYPKAGGWQGRRGIDNHKKYYIMKME